MGFRCCETGSENGLRLQIWAQKGSENGSGGECTKWIQNGSCENPASQTCVVGALIVRIGFRGMYHKHNQDPPPNIVLAMI